MVEVKQLSQWSVIGWVTKNFYLEFLRASEGTLSRWPWLHLQSLAPANPPWARVVGKRRVMAHGVRADGVVRGASAGGAGGGRPAVQLTHRAHTRRHGIVALIKGHLITCHKNIMKKKAVASFRNLSLHNHHHHQPINVPTAGAQAFPMDGIGRLGHDPPRGPNADWHNPIMFQELKIEDDESLFASHINFHDPTVIYFSAFLEQPDDGSGLQVREGAIRGIIVEPASRRLEPVEVFWGVPYAGQPPRLGPPPPPPSWPGTRLADAFAPVCPQKYPDISNKSAALSKMPLGIYNELKATIPFLANQSEDCLYLNIYVPGSGARGVEAPYAVVVWAGGRSHEWGSANTLDGAVLAARAHLLVVTINYRLGLLGYLTTGARLDPAYRAGGAAALDVSAALAWVQRNVAAFGGDPRRVTLAGHGAGAALVNSLLMMPEAKGTLLGALQTTGRRGLFVREAIKIASARRYLRLPSPRIQSTRRAEAVSSGIARQLKWR
ncbi:hypothetical protein evm_011007 [Chilo suppressalis]|nr:hypothetical protein evm_011007 [Chilo suppressalis]